MRPVSVRPVSLIALIAGALAIAAPSRSSAGSYRVSRRGEAEATGAVRSGAGMVLYYDETTGQFTAPPPGRLGAVAEEQGALGLAERAVEVPGTSEAGGTTYYLGRRFGMESGAERSADGRIGRYCVPLTGARAGREEE